MYNIKNIYKQCFGTPMELPLSPIIVDLVLQDLEMKVMGSLCLDCKFYFRCVDDIIMTAQKKDIPLIMNVFNSYHERLTFTIEHMKDNSISSFLDLNIVIENTNIILDWFYKKTASDRLLSFYSYHPTSQKIGTIIGLIDYFIIRLFYYYIRDIILRIS